MNKTKIIGGMIIIAVVFFYGGYAYGNGRATNKVGTFAYTNGMNAGTNGGAVRVRGGSVFSGGGISGEILSKDDQSLTVKLGSGGSRIVFLGASTAITKSVVGTTDDLFAGLNVMVGGTQNSDGSLTATSVQIRPQGIASSTRMIRQ